MFRSLCKTSLLACLLLSTAYAKPIINVIIKDNEVSPQATQQFIHSLAGQHFSMLMVDIMPQSREDGEAIAQDIISCGSIPALYGYKLPKATPEGIAGLLSTLAQQPNAYIAVQNAQFSKDQSLAIAQNMGGSYFFNCEIADSREFVELANLPFENTNFRNMKDDAFVNAVLDRIDPSALDNLSVSLPLNFKKLTSQPIIRLLTMAQNGKQRSISLNLERATGVDDSIAGALQTFLSKTQPQHHAFNFSGVQGDSMAILHAMTAALPPPQTANLSPYSAFIFNDGTLQGLSEQDWSFLIKNYASLQIARNNIGSSISQMVAPLSQIQGRTTFWYDFSANNITDDQAQQLFPALAAYTDANPPTEAFYLAIGGNPWGDAGVDAFVNFLDHLAVNVSQFPWNQISLKGSQFSEDNWVKIFTSLQKLNLSSLNLRKCNLTPKALASLGDLLQGSPHIWYIDMGKAQITDDGITAFSQRIQNIPSFPGYFLLSHNQIEDEGAKALAQALKTIQNPSRGGSISIDHNPLGAEGAKALVEVNLERDITSPIFGDISFDARELFSSYAKVAGGFIGLPNCRVTTEQAVELASILTQNPVFSHLYLHNNQIDDDGLIALGNALKSLGHQHHDAGTSVDAMLHHLPKPLKLESPEMFENVKSLRKARSPESNTWCTIQ